MPIASLRCSVVDKVLSLPQSHTIVHVNIANFSLTERVTALHLQLERLGFPFPITFSRMNLLMVLLFDWLDVYHSTNEI